MTADADPEARALVQRCLAGDRGAWDEFIRRYTSLIAETVRRTLRRFGKPADPHRLLDLVQETFVRLLRDGCAPLRRFGWQRPFHHFLISVATNCCIDDLRKERPGAAWEPNVLADLLPGDLRDVAAGLEREDLEGRIRKGLDRLAPRERLALRFFYWDALPAKTIGAVLGLQEGAVWTLLTRARGRLTEFLRKSMLNL